jgi:phage-related protein
MACTTIASIVKDCENNNGGIYEMLVTDQDNILTTTVDPVDYEITAITKTIAFNEIEFKRYVGNYVEDLVSSNENGSQVVTATITLNLHRRDGAKSKALKILAEGNRYLAIILKDGNGKYWYFPYAQLTASGEGSGTGKVDGSRYSVTFIAENEAFAYLVDPTIIAGLLTV